MWFVYCYRTGSNAWLLNSLGNNFRVVWYFLINFQLGKEENTKQNKTHIKQCVQSSASSWFQIKDLFFSIAKDLFDFVFIYTATFKPGSWKVTENNHDKWFGDCPKLLSHLRWENRLKIDPRTVFKAKQSYHWLNKKANKPKAILNLVMNSLSQIIGKVHKFKLYVPVRGLQAGQSWEQVLLVCRHRGSEISRTLVQAREVEMSWRLCDSFCVSSLMTLRWIRLSRIKRVLI